jgi:nitric oxide reductase NorQ protein
VALSFDYPKPELEARIIRHETGLDEAATAKLLKLAEMTRNLKGNGLEEGASTRLLVHAGKLIAQGVEPRAACQGAIALALTDDEDMITAINELIAALF